MKKKKSFLLLIFLSILIGILSPITCPTLYTPVEIQAATTLPAPEITSVKASGSNSITIKWNAVEGADGYRVYRKAAGDKSWTRITTLTNPNTLSYKNSKLKMGYTYTYTVRAYKLVNNTKNWGKYSKTGKSATTTIPAPTLTSAKGTNTKSVTIKWKKVSNASGYRIYRKELKTQEWVKLATLSSGTTTTYKDSTPKMGIQYYYTVRAYRTVNGKKVWGKYNKTGLLAYTQITAPKLLSIKASADGTNTITWQPIENVYAHRIYRKTASTKWKKLDDTFHSSSTYTDNTCIPGETYYYTVRAVTSTSGTYTYGLYNKTGLKATTAVPIPISIDAKPYGVGEMNVTWTGDTRADGYRIYRKTLTQDTWSKWKLLATVTDGSTMSYIDDTAEPGSTYRYTIRAIKTKGAKTLLSNYNSYGKKVECKAPAVKLLTLQTNSEGKPVITWEPLKKADGYRIYRKDTVNGYSTAWNKIATLSGETVSSYIDQTDLQEGQTYHYTVRAYSLIDKQKKWGLYDKTGLGLTTEVQDPETPELLSAISTTPTSITISWEKVEDAHGYFLYKMSNGSWSYEADIEDANITTYTDTQLKSEAIYSYTIASYKLYNGVRYLSERNETGISAITLRGELGLSHTDLILCPDNFEALTLLGTSMEATWKSTNPDVAYYSDGYVHAVSFGAADIIATFENTEYVCHVKVEDPKFNTDNIILKVGESTVLKVLDTTLNIKWTELHTDDCIKLSEKEGYHATLTAMKPGVITLWADIESDSGNIITTLECNIEVVGTLELPQNEYTIKVGESIDIVINSSYEQLSVRNSESYLETYWKSISDSKHVLTINGKIPGSTILTIRPSYFDSSVSGTIRITIEPSDSVTVVKERLKNHIRTNGTYNTAGNPYIEYTGTAMDIGYGKDHLYTWTIVYEAALNRLGFTMTTQLNDGTHTFHMYLPMEEVEETTLFYTWNDITSTTVIVNELYGNYALTFEIPDAGLSNSAVIHDYANQWKRLAFKGWELYLLRPQLGISMCNIGFSNYFDSGWN